MRIFAGLVRLLAVNPCGENLSDPLEESVQCDSFVCIKPSDVVLKLSPNILVPRNKDIRAELKDYVTGLDTDERIALHAFLKGIGQILTAGIDSEQADEPSEDPHDIKMSRDDGSDSGGTTPRPKQKQKKKHGAVKKPVNRAKQRGLEDTSAPIQVGRKQATEGIRRRIRELMG